MRVSYTRKEKDSSCWENSTVRAHNHKASPNVLASSVGLNSALTACGAPCVFIEHVDYQRLVTISFRSS